MMPILVKSDDVRSGRKAKVPDGQLWAAQELMGEDQLSTKMLMESGVLIECQPKG